MSLKLCTWTQKQPEQGPKGEDLYVEITGTRKELIDSIEIDGYTYNYHMWVNQWTGHQAALDNETFNGRTQINVVCDYGSAYAMSQADVEKCGHGTSCNQYVALVLHSPRDRVDAGGGVVAGPRSVICDVWRIWSQKKGNAAWHQKALKEIATYYRDGDVPDLERVGVKSDGQRDQFKGQRNLGLTAEWPHPNVTGADCLCMPRGRACNTQTMQPGLEIEVFHDFPASHHGSGPVDNYSKDTRRGMDEDVAEGRLVRYNYEHCYDWCVKNMSKPSEDKKHLGTFGANGKYLFRAYSDGKDANPRGFPVIPENRSFQSLQGSNEIYAWRAVSKHKPELEALFVPCYCEDCRGAHPKKCKYRHITHSLVGGLEPEVYTVHEKKKQATEDSDSDSDYN